MRSEEYATDLLTILRKDGIGLTCMKMWMDT